HAILRILPAPGVITDGSLFFVGKNLFLLQSVVLRLFRWHAASMVFQSSLAALHPTIPIEGLFKDTAKAHDLPYDPNHVKRLLDMVDLEQAVLRNYPHELSGGMRQRVVIALALMLKPKLIIFDEPTTALDVLVEREILNRIHDLQREYGFAALIVTHDLPLIMRYADRIGIMKYGVLLEEGTPKQLQKNAQHSYTQTLMKAAQNPFVQRKPRQKEVVFHADNLHRAFGDKQVVRGVSFSLYRGNAMALIGASGCGKSTTARMVCGLLRPDQGRLSLLGQTLHGTHPKIQMIFQDPFAALNPVHTVAHHLHRPLKTIGIKSKKERDARILELLEEVELDPDFVHRYPHQLSGGQRQRVVIARALAVKPAVLIADEPTSMLDLSIRRGVLDLLVKLCEQGISILMITHDIRAAGYLCSEIHVMDQGVIVEADHAENIIYQSTHPHTRKLISATEAL
ncbi:MAG: ABC transporter ATP-binding protein, partial [Myxococcota bacterium]|nr:ABC transporter ATP-binding protein [Myxococcota bacterium]